MTLNTMTFSKMAFSTMPPGIMTFSMPCYIQHSVLNIIPVSKWTVNTLTFRKMTLLKHILYLTINHHVTLVKHLYKVFGERSKK
jgi:hypothetical protein